MNGAVTWNNAAGTSVIGSVSDTGGWAFGLTASQPLVTTRPNQNVYTRTLNLRNPITSIGGGGSPATDIVFIDFYNRANAPKWSFGIHESQFSGTETNPSMMWYSHNAAAYVGGIASAGAWTLGPLGGTLTTGHKVQAGTSTDTATFTIENNKATSARAMLVLSPATGTDGSDIKWAGTGGLYFKNTSNTEVGQISNAGAWTFGVNATNQTHVLNGVLTARGYSSGGTIKHLFQNRDSANTSGGSAFLKVESFSSDTGVIIAPLGVEKWYIFSNPTNAPANGLVFSHASNGNVGQITESGAWTLGPSGSTAKNVIVNGAVSARTFIPELNPAQATAFSLSATSPEYIYISSPTSAINQDLPTTNVTAGQLFRLIVTGATSTNTVTLRSSNADTIDIIAGSGYILVQALQAAPTAAAHWKVLDVYEEASYIFTSTGLTSNQTLTFNFTRHNKRVTVSFDGVGSRTKDGSNGPIRFGAIASRFTPIRTQANVIYGLNTTAAPLAAWVRPTSYIDFYPFNSSGAASNFSAGQTPIGFADTYTITYDLQ